MGTKTLTLVEEAGARGSAMPQWPPAWGRRVVRRSRDGRAGSPTRTPPLLSRLTVAAVSAVILLLSAGGCTAGPSSSPPSLGGPESTGGVPLGAFLGSDAEGVRRIDGFTSWLGREATVGHTYLPGSSWRDLEGPDWIIDPWTAWSAAKPGRTLVINVPVLAPSEPAVDDQETVRLLQLGVDGQFDRHFQALAQRLVQRQAAQAILVLGWEMNGTTYSGRCAPDPAAWKAYWRRIVAVMRNVPGQAFRFDFAPVRGVQDIPWTQCYPGDDVVDIVGMDTYDQPQGGAFSEFVSEPYGLSDHSSFAEQHGKPMSYPEWGLFDNGDNPAYIKGMHGWISAHDVAYQTITDYCPHGVWVCPANPDAAQTYRQLFGVRGDGRPSGS
jgi:hypothetical protein